ncbi:MAG: D-tyrosyl-tRNA(Tyr) deacylase [Armatimonadetes bacterium]|nr:D-tyrosyl-tRNA(Tyr) deacylase [Armatimonadota bacterium]MBS1711467.1 D-tyrosyl-tRNA(Tyr) deacylase [Armatimonadota bacterium]MBX3107608.1 D-tyrosyl-tRNA(Tyr) deacylase [Fimbriimonadaceae bacterium]
MRAVVQRVSRAEVSVGGEVVGRCGPGLLVLLAAHRHSVEPQSLDLADRVAGLRIFSDSTGKMNLALKDLPDSGEPQVLVVSQFTLYADAYSSRRPSFTESAGYDQGKALYESFVRAIKPLVRGVQTGEFGAHMEVSLVNDGPVTLVIDAR